MTIDASSPLDPIASASSQSPDEPELAPGVRGDTTSPPITHTPEATRGEVGTRPHAGRPIPYLLLAGVAALAVPIRAALGPIRDIDTYWHLLVGRDILAGIPVAVAGRGWSFAPVPDTWVSTQWLAEVVFARLEMWGGLDALIVYRVATTILALVVLGAVTLVHRPVRAGAWMFALAALGLSMTVQERSEQLTFILAPLLGRWAERLLREGRLPRWWVVLPLVVIWSNYHGGWVLLPAVLGLAGVARLVDRGWRDQVAYRAWLLASLCFAAAAVSPTGADNALAAIRFSQSTAMIAEWQPVRLWGWDAIAFVLVVLIILMAWALGRRRPTAGEVLMVLAIAVFGVIAWRNLTPATLLLAPIGTGILARALGEQDPRSADERLPLVRMAATLAIVGALTGVVLAVRQSPVVPPNVPQRLLTVIREAPEPQRVLDTYNLSGALLWFGGPPPHVLVGIDGRADRNGNAYFEAYQTDMVNAQPGWEKLFDQLKPTCALLTDKEALSAVLVAQRGWIEVGREGDAVLLRAPTTTGFPTSG